MDLLECLQAEDARFLVVGAHAMAVHGAVRSTGDLDLLVRPDPENEQRVFRALVDFGAPVDATDLTVRDLALPGTVYQIGVAPRRIDVLTEISGLDFDEAWSSLVSAEFGGLTSRIGGNSLHTPTSPR